MSADEEGRSEDLYAEIAAITVGEFTSNEVVSIASILRRDLAPPKSLTQVTPIQVAMAVLKRKAIHAAGSLITLTDPTKIAAAQARIAAYADIHETLHGIIEGGEEVWRLMQEADRMFMAEELGLDYGSPEGEEG